ncbi:hypothetical protein [Spirochaeta cellobiosiphila]|uniref:hypothetical protein n=1 Tax=Spirochaeta cellobiosiphila TaxID=504483 RepID=UPI000406F766|nr:hypothetical protein [Spirochaeta cellobiosiphila]
MILSKNTTFVVLFLLVALLSWGGGQKEKDQLQPKRWDKELPSASEADIFEDDSDYIIYYDVEFRNLFSEDFKSSIAKSIKKDLYFEEFHGVFIDEKAIYFITKETARRYWDKLQKVSAISEDIVFEGPHSVRWGNKLIPLGFSPYIIALQTSVNWQFPSSSSEWLDVVDKLRMPQGKVLVPDYVELINPISEQLQDGPLRQSLITTLQKVGPKDWELDTPYGHKKYYDSIVGGESVAIWEPSFHLAELAEGFDEKKWFLYVNTNLPNPIEEGLFMGFSLKMGSGDRKAVERTLDYMRELKTRQQLIDKLCVKPLDEDSIQTGDSYLKRSIMSYNLQYAEWNWEYDKILQVRQNLELVSRGVVVTIP